MSRAMGGYIMSRAKDIDQLDPGDIKTTHYICRR